MLDRILNFFKGLWSKRQQQIDKIEFPAPPMPYEDNPPDDIKDPWMDVARLELGTKELPHSNPRIEEYLKSTDLDPKLISDKTAWCSAFVCWCLQKAGMKSTESAWARSYLKYGEVLKEPKEGCIVIFDRGHGYGHVGFCSSFDRDGINLLAGNQGNRVCVERWSKDKVLGYRWPVK